MSRIQQPGTNSLDGLITAAVAAIDAATAAFDKPPPPHGMEPVETPSSTPAEGRGGHLWKTPWHIERPTKAERLVVNSNGGLVAACEIEEEAVLIVAAPVLFEALEEIASNQKRDEDTGRCDECNSPREEGHCEDCSYEIACTALALLDTEKK